MPLNPLMLLGALVNIVPGIAGTLAKGTKAETVVSVGAKVARDLLGTDDPTAVETALSDPKTAETFKARLETELAAERIHLEDVANARQMQIQLASTKSPTQYTPVILTFVVMLMMPATVGFLLWKPYALPEWIQALLNIIIGAEISAFTAVIQYWFGSSSSSKRNGDAVREIAVNGTRNP